MKNTTRIRNNNEVLLFVLSELGGARKKIPTEEIAFRAYQLAPDRFSWSLQKYKNYPDKYVVVWTLKDLRKSKYREMVFGDYGRGKDSHKDGWMLTKNGIEWIEKNRIRLKNLFGKEADDLSNIPPDVRKRFLKKISNNTSFILYSRDKSLRNVSKDMFADLLEISPDAPLELFKTKFNYLLNEARLIKDKNLLSFLEDCNYKFLSG